MTRSLSGRKISFHIYVSIRKLLQGMTCLLEHSEGNLIVYTGYYGPQRRFSSELKSVVGGGIGGAVSISNHNFKRS